MSGKNAAKDEVVGTTVVDARRLYICYQYISLIERKKKRSERREKRTRRKSRLSSEYKTNKKKKESAEWHQQGNCCR